MFFPLGLRLRRIFERAKQQNVYAERGASPVAVLASAR
jgi:hypothetical protein